MMRVVSSAAKRSQMGCQLSGPKLDSSAGVGAVDGESESDGEREISSFKGSVHDRISSRVRVEACCKTKGTMPTDDMKMKLRRETA